MKTMSATQLVAMLALATGLFAPRLSTAETPLGSAPSVASGQPAHPARLKPFTAFSWSPALRLSHISGMLLNNGDPVKMAFTTRNMPDGCKVILGIGVPDGLVGNPGDLCTDTDGRRVGVPGIWPESGIALVSRRCRGLFSGFTFAHGTCDLLVLDYEQGWSHWAMSARQFSAIEHDPRFPPIEKRLGFDDLPERAFNWRAHPGDAAKWESVSTGLLRDALERAVGTAWRNELPDAGLCNYGSVTISKENAVPDLNGNVQYYEDKPVGTCQSPPLYGAVGNIRLTGTPGDWTSPMTALVWSADTVRASVRSCDVPVMPWLAFRSYRGDDATRQVPWSGTDYWQENVFHAMLSSAGNNVLFWNPHPQREISPTGTGKRGATPEDEQSMDTALADLAKQAHDSPLATALLTDNVDYGTSVLVSAARTQAGHVVARVTFAPGTDAVDVKINGTPYHVSKPIGSVGAWVQVR